MTLKYECKIFTSYIVLVFRSLFYGLLLPFKTFDASVFVFKFVVLDYGDLRVFGYAPLVLFPHF